MHLAFSKNQLTNILFNNLLKKEVHANDKALTNLRTKEFRSVCVTNLFLFIN
jgi:hypothetical protein